MNPRDFCSLAYTLTQEAKRKPSPERCRTAISRAYYAAYNVAIEILSNMNIHILGQGGDKHVIVRQYLNNSGDSAMKKAKEDLKNLHQIRKEADYYLHNSRPEQPKTALGWVKVASQVIHILDSRSNDPKVIQTLKRHHRLRTSRSN